MDESDVARITLDDRRHAWLHLAGREQADLASYETGQFGFFQRLIHLTERNFAMTEITVMLRLTHVMPFVVGE
jgi:hypothetical protein